MTVWIDEDYGELTIKTISIWLKKGIQIRVLGDKDKTNDEDIIISPRKKHNKFAKCLTYEEILEIISNNIMQEINYNYDYYYLQNVLRESKQNCIDTIITDSSYGLFGIAEELLSTAINMSLPSEDLYYAVRGIYDVCEHNKNIVNIVLCCGYYYFYCDLSKTKNISELERVSKVYYPIYGDMHNCLFLPPRANVLMQSHVFAIDRILEMYTSNNISKTYFNSEIHRKNMATKVWDDKTKEWHQLNEIEKVQAGFRRAEEHNKVYKYVNTMLENKALFKQLSEFCMRQGINLMVVVTPATKYYRECLYTGFKETFMDILNETEGVIHFLDLYDSPDYLEEDFNDTDHLSDLGAHKMSAAVLHTLRQISK